MRNRSRNIAHSRTWQRVALCALTTLCLLDGVASAAPVASQGMAEPVLVAVPKMKSFASDSTAWNEFHKQGLELFLANRLVQKLEVRGRLRPLGPQAMTTLLDAQDQAAIGRFSTATEGKLRQSLGARYVLYVSVAEFGVQGVGPAEVGQIGLVVTLVDIEIGTPVVRFAMRREAGSNAPPLGATASLAAWPQPMDDKGLTAHEALLLQQASEAVLDASIDRVLKDLPR